MFLPGADVRGGARFEWLSFFDGGWCIFPGAVLGGNRPPVCREASRPGKRETGLTVNTEEKETDHGHLDAFPTAVRLCDIYSLHLRPAHSWAFHHRGHDGNQVRAHRGRNLQTHGQVLGQTVSDQLRPGRGHRHHPGVPVRHQLVALFDLCRRYFRVAAGHRSHGGLLFGIHLPWRVDLRLEPAVAQAPLYGHLAGGLRRQLLGPVDHPGQRLHAAPGGLRHPQRPGRTVELY